jgi:hypothetical protein
MTEIDIEKENKAIAQEYKELLQLSNVVWRDKNWSVRLLMFL